MCVLLVCRCGYEVLQYENACARTTRERADVCVHARAYDGRRHGAAAAAVRSDVALAFVCLRAWARARVHRAQTCALGRVCLCALCALPNQI